MGRPLNKKFFGNASEKLLVSAALGDGGGTPENCSIIKQKSNLKYLVQSESATAPSALTTSIQYRVVSVGTTDFTLVGGQNVVGSIFTATGTTAGTGSTAEVYICKLTDSTPNAVGEMTIGVTPENAVTPRQATIDITQTGGLLDVGPVTISDGGYGYWTDETGVAVPGGTGGTVDYTVSNGSIVSVTVNAQGTGYSNSTQNLGTFDAFPPTQLARIINAHLVKTFEGNTYAWPTIAPLGGTRGLFGEADLDEQA